MRPFLVPVLIAIIAFSVIAVLHLPAGKREPPGGPWTQPRQAKPVPADTFAPARNDFAEFTLFTAHHRTRSGTNVWFTETASFSGPVHTNERFCFAGNPSARFSDRTTQYHGTARYFNDGNRLLLDSASNGTRDVPRFDRGFSRGTGKINFMTTLTAEQMKACALGPDGEWTNGIRVVNDGTGCTGGIYIRGNRASAADNAVITMSVDKSGRQVFVICQGWGSPATTVTVDSAGGRTIVTDSSGTRTYAGIPDGTGHEGVLIYAADDIGSLSGTVQAGMKVTVASERDIRITNHIRYQGHRDSPIPEEGNEAVLGILSWDGDVRIGTQAPDNVEIHAVVMAPRGAFTVDNYDAGQDRGTVTLLGSAITDFYGAFGTFGGLFGDTGYGRDFVYDRRLGEGLWPPYFPRAAGFRGPAGPGEGLTQEIVWQVEEKG